MSRIQSLRLTIELIYDADLMHGDDAEARDWFFGEVLRADPNDLEACLSLLSGTLGDSVGTVRVLTIEETRS